MFDTEIGFGVCVIIACLVVVLLGVVLPAITYNFFDVDKLKKEVEALKKDVKDSRSSEGDKNNEKLPRVPISFNLETAEEIMNEEKECDECC